MLKKSTILAIPIFIVLAFACRKEPAGTDTAATDTSVTTATDAGTTAAPETMQPPSAYAADHYKFWKVASVKAERSVKLQGQFDREPWEARVRSIEYLGNPVVKNDEPIQHRDWHLVAYALDVVTIQPIRTVTIRNQFHKDSAKITVTAPAWLLLPSSKSLDGAPGDVPKEADHYVCYNAAADKLVEGPVILVDQFDEKRGKKEEIRQLRTSFFCVPVSKDGGPIHNAKDHLTVYLLDPRDPFEIAAKTRDQFGEHELRVQRSEYLAVPTTKIEFQQQ